MSELTEKEFWFIRVSFKGGRFYPSDSVIAIAFDMLKYHSFGGAEEIINSLVEKKVLDASPDKRSIKFTDYGLELYNSMVRAQKEWEAQTIIKISNLDRDQVLIRAGETFKANRVLREIVLQVQKELCVIDPYIGSMFFDLIEDVGSMIPVRIITSDKVQKAVVTAYLAFKNQYCCTEMKKTGYEIHDRYILWDGAHGFHLGHSIKDLGTKDTQLNLLKNASEQWKLFEQRWKEASSIT
jgi:hypothetical protein